VEGGFSVLDEAIHLLDKRFHLMGRMKSKRSITARMELSGAKYRDKFTTLTNILVIPDNAQEQSLPQTLAVAREMEQRGELTILSESQIEAILSADMTYGVDRGAHG